MHRRAILALALMLTAPLSGCIVPENMTALREELGYASVELPDVVAKARASTLTPRVHEDVTLTAEVEGLPLENATIEWTLGDTTRAGPSITHAFTQPGPVPVNLTVSGDGSAAHDALTLTVEENARPTAEITLPPASSLVAGETVTLSASSSSDPDGDELTYAWTIDGTPTGTGPTLEHAFDAGVHQVKLTVSDGLEAVAAFQQVPVEERLAAAGNLSATEDTMSTSFEVREGIEGLEVTLEHTTTLGADDVDLLLLDDAGETVASASTEPSPGTSTAKERLSLPGSELSPGPYTLEARLERGANATVSLTGTLTYAATGG